MESYDPEVAAQVWQRVRSPQPEAAESLLELITLEWTGAGVYLALSRRMEPQEAAVLRQLSQQSRAHAACLKGIYTLSAGSCPPLHPAPPERDTPDAALRKCYGREMRCLAAYEGRIADRAYGAVFSRLAAQTQEHCRLVLELIGRRSGR